jgi:alpha-galactosidase
MSWLTVLFGALVSSATSGPVPAEMVTPGEMAVAHSWMTGRFRGTPDVPFSFTYDGRPSADLLRTWEFKYSFRRLDELRRERVLIYTDPKTGLVVRCVVVTYRDYPVVEWTLYFKNTGSGDTLILADIRALDVRFERNSEGEFVLHHNVGSPCQPNDYQPLETKLGPKATKRITAAGGRPTNSDLPYFNIAWPDEGVIAVIGWPGQWAADFTRDEGTGLRVRGGQELTHFRLRPGEEARSPLVVLQFYKGDRIRSQNVWRRWMIAHNLPRPAGRLPPVQMAACSSHQYGEMINANTDSQILFVDRYLEEKLKLDYWWMDAGWYWNKGGWPNTGTWEVDTKRFPGGLRPISDHAHAKGVRIIVWFEPERVTPGTWLYEKHPDWLLGRDGAQKLLNLGNPEARAWLTDHVDKLLTEQGIDLYRQDFNMDPLDYWRNNDAEDRQGLTEIHHVEGYLAYWDELRRRHPNMLIDSCASGGRRNDLETLRRAVPLLRSDYIIEPVGNQCHTYGIASWIPYYGTGSGAVDVYMLRSTLCPHFTACFDMRRRDLGFDLVRRVMGQWRSFAEYYLGDYYPLTPYNLENAAWMAWQFDRPDLRGGVVQAFRRAESTSESMRFKLQGLDAAARYTVRNLDAPNSAVMTGEELMTGGLPVVMKNRPEAAVITYKVQ